MKNNKGITLIALVITIIVLLILAGVAIAMLGGDNGILTKSRQAKADNQLGTAKDQISLICTEALHDYYDATYVTSDTATYSEVGVINKMVDAINATTTTSAISPVTMKTAPAKITGTTATEVKFVLSYNERKVEGTITVNGSLTWGNMEKDA